MIKVTCNFPLINQLFRGLLDPSHKQVGDYKLSYLFFFVQVSNIWCLFLQLSVNTTLRIKQLALLQIEEIYCSSLDLAQIQETFSKGYGNHFIMCYFPLALIWSLIALTILTHIIFNMFILLLHLQLSCKVNIVRTNFDMNLGWLNPSRPDPGLREKVILN